MLSRYRSFFAVPVTLAALGVACGAAKLVAQTSDAQPAEHQQLAQPVPKTAVVLRFAVQSQPVTDDAALSARACPAPIETVQPQKPLTVEPKILDAISAEMEKKLATKMTVLIDPDPKTIPAGAMVISGCITRSNAGNSAERLVGMGLGASHLDVHVIVLTRTRRGWAPYDAFDIQVKGGSMLPPLGPVGLAVHAARDTQQTLSADARKLADKILKQIKKDTKAGAVAKSEDNAQGI